MLVAERQALSDNASRQEPSTSRHLKGVYIDCVHLSVAPRKPLAIQTVHT